MKHIIFLMISTIIICTLISCEDNYKDTGLAKGDHDGPILDYMKRDNDNWDSTVIMIYHAGLENLYSGTDPNYPDGITFFGPTNAAIRQYILKTLDNGKQKYHAVTDIPAEECRKMLLSHTIPGKKMMKDFDYEIKGTLDGGTLINNLIGNQLRIYRIQSDAYDIPGLGPESLGVHSQRYGHIFIVVSCNINTTSGIVHSTDYILSEL